MSRTMFFIRTKTSIHEGGTKFYETIEVGPEGGDVVVALGRWGAVKHGTVPIGGQALAAVGIAAGSRTFAFAKRADKEKRGYTKWRVREEMFSADQTKLRLYGYPTAPITHNLAVAEIDRLVAESVAFDRDVLPVVKRGDPYRDYTMEPSVPMPVRSASETVEGWATW